MTIPRPGAPLFCSECRNADGTSARVGDEALPGPFAVGGLLVAGFGAGQGWGVGRVSARRLIVWPRSAAKPAKPAFPVQPQRGTATIKVS